MPSIPRRRASVSTALSPDSAVGLSPRRPTAGVSEQRKFTMAEVSAHSSAGSCWVASNGKVYDVTDFLADHPGGTDIVVQWAGKNIDQALQDATVHVHSECAYAILDEHCLIGWLRADSSISAAANHKSASFLDLNKPLIHQMFTSTFSKDFYLDQVHQPRFITGHALFFGNPFLNFFTKTSWWVIPLIWLPVSLFLAYQATMYMSLDKVLAYSAFGLLLWTFTEYTFHRFFFHIDKLMPDHPYACAIHFLLHGVHHFLPMDKARLVMPPLLFLPLVTGPFALAQSLFPYPIAVALFSGLLLGYIAYDMTHYYLHHGHSMSSYFRDLKSYHLDHHYKNANLGYGVSSKLWDYVFGTVLYRSSTNELQL